MSVELNEMTQGKHDETYSTVAEVHQNPEYENCQPESETSPKHNYDSHYQTLTKLPQGQNSNYQSLTGHRLRSNMSQERSASVESKRLWLGIYIVLSVTFLIAIVSLLLVVFRADSPGCNCTSPGCNCVNTGTFIKGQVVIYH